jgi:hypothetical protein
MCGLEVIRMMSTPWGPRPRPVNDLWTLGFWENLVGKIC